MNDSRKARRGLLVMITNGDSGRKSSPVRVGGGEGGGELGTQLVQLHRLDTVINLRQNLLGESVGANCQSSSGASDPLEHLIKANRLGCAITLYNTHTKRHGEI